MANPFTFDFCGTGNDFQLRSAEYLCEEQSWKTSFVCVINQTVNAGLAQCSVSLLTWWPSVCCLAHMPVSVCLAKLSDDDFTQ